MRRCFRDAFVLFLMPRLVNSCTRYARSLLCDWLSCSSRGWRVFKTSLTLSGKIKKNMLARIVTTGSDNLWFKGLVELVVLKIS